MNNNIDNPIVSVVIPTYNRKDIISRAIESVRNQTYKNYEIIIVDDGSTDGTVDYIKNHYNNKIHCISQENQGASSARNKGISEAKGKYIAFLDSDDEWVDSKLTTQVAFLEENPEIALLCGRTYRSDNIKKVNSPLAQKITGNLFTILYSHSFVSTPTVIVKKDVLDQVGAFDLNYKSAEDFDLWLKITHDYQCAFLPDLVAIVNRGKDNLSTDKITLHIHALDILEKHYDKRLIPDRVYKKAISNSLIALGRNYLTSGQTSKAKECFIRSFKLYPFRLRSLRYLLKTSFRNSKKENNQT
ncbi:MAG: glycosyltransferase [Desulfobacteraceae bacterium]|nr:glycosyltransferase [Desulfobacteraceae bacterium]